MNATQKLQIDASFQGLYEQIESLHAKIDTLSVELKSEIRQLKLGDQPAIPPGEHVDGKWTLPAEHPHLLGQWSTLFQALNNGILGLGDSIRRQINKYYVVYRKNGNPFVEIRGKFKTRLNLCLRTDSVPLEDPRGICLPLRKRNGWSVIFIATTDDDRERYLYQLHSIGDLASLQQDIDYIIDLVHQVYRSDSAR